MGPPSYTWSVVRRNVVMRRIPVCITMGVINLSHNSRLLPLAWRVGCRMNRLHMINEPKSSGNRRLSDKIMALLNVAHQHLVYA